MSATTEAAASAVAVCGTLSSAMKPHLSSALALALALASASASRKSATRVAMALCALGLCACRADPGYARMHALDLPSLPGPAPADFSSESTLATRKAAIEAVWATGQGGSFGGVAGVSIHYHVNDPGDGRAAVVILPGRTEAAEKYAEVAADLVQQGYAVYALDHRGQGASGRMTADPDVGYVEFFSDYVDDLDTFVRTVVQKQAHAHLYLLAHSMGGAIGVLYVDAHPEVFTAAALSAPMLEIDTGAFPPAVALSIGASDCNLSDGKGYAIGSSDYGEEKSVAESTVTHSAARWQWKIDLYRAHPELRLGGVSYRWLCESLAASSRAQTLGRYSNLPTLLFQAGADSVVRPGGESHYCADAARCQLANMPGSFHEVLHEVDATRNVAMSGLVRFFRHWENP